MNFHATFLSLIVHTRLLSIFMNEVSYCSRVVQLFSFASLISFIFFNDNKLNVEFSFDVLVVVSFLFIYQLFPFLYLFFFLSRCLQFVNAFHAYFIELFFPYSLFTSFFISIVFFSLRFSFTFHLFCSFFFIVADVCFSSAPHCVDVVDGRWKINNLLIAYH